MVETEHYIGQVLYVVSSKNLEIIPIVISEQVYVKTLSGSNVSWTAIIGPPGQKRKTVDITKIKEKKFSSIEEAKKHLMKNFETLIDNALRATVSNREKWYKQDIPDSLGVSDDGVSYDSIGELSGGAPSPGSVEPSQPIESEEEARQRLREALQADEKEETEQGQPTE